MPSDVGETHVSPRSIFVRMMQGARACKCGRPRHGEKDEHDWRDTRK